MPVIMYFLKIKKKINNGTVANIEPQIFAGSSLANSEDWNFAIKPLDTRCMSLPKVGLVPEAMRVGQIYAFHAPMSERIIIVTIVGEAIGIMTLNK